MIVQFGSVIILSRLLVPADFGLLAMVAPFYGLALLFQDLGPQSCNGAERGGHMGAELGSVLA